MSGGKWTLAEAQAARANRRHGAAHRTVAPVAAPLTAALTRAARVFGPALDRATLARASGRMNRNMVHGFDGYTPRAGDIFASAYFKAGTNWVMYICHQIAQLGQAEFDHIQDIMPWPDAAEPRYWLSLDDPAPYASPTGYRTIKSHLPATALPLSDQANYIGVTRDPKDCAASAWHYVRTILLGPAMPPPDTWLKQFASDDALFGRWDVFTASWHAAADKATVLFLRFEEIRADPAAAIDRIATFLGIDMLPQERARVIEATDFNRMREINAKFYPVRQSLWTDPEGKIIRKGTVGDGQSLFSPESLAWFDQQMATGLARLGSDFPYDDIYGLRTAAATGSK